MADSVESGIEGTFAPPADLQKDAYVSSMDQYKKMYKQSVEDPVGFWGAIADEFYWRTPPSKEKFLDFNFDVNKGPIRIKWMQDAVTNVSYNMLDRHVKNGLGNKVAFYWEGNDPDDIGQITYKELLSQVCKFANVLKSKGLKKGDRVAIYMPMIVEIVTAMLACARLGLVHSIVFGGFSSNSLAERLLDGKCAAVLAADGAWRGEKLLNLKSIADGALHICEEQGHEIKVCIVVRHLTPSEEAVTHDGALHWRDGRDCWWHDEMEKASDDCEPEWMNAEDPLFMLYTSGSTGKPKGVLHTCGGYMLYAASTTKFDFDLKPDDIYWCTADVGWITGHTYVCYGPLANGVSSVIFEGTPFYPDPGRFWAVVDKYKVSKFYTAPTAIRSLMKFGDSYVTKYSRESLKVLGTVGEPINPEAWLWYHRVIGNGKCAIVDTFWQTETGGHAITSLPGATPTKPGSATFPFFGISPFLLTEEGKVIEGEGEGYLVFNQPWPGIMRTVYGNHERFETTYFKKFPGYYCTGDGAKRDKDGYLWITGRIDDMMNMSGHLISTAEVESVLIENPCVAETAVVARPHDVKGECLYCFITLRENKEFTKDLISELRTAVRKRIGPFAQPDFVQEAPGLPKTRSGKIMRRVLRKIAVGDRELGDVSTMADESVIDLLFKLRPENA
ncbi:hypothetical protein CAPTEDRAFT_133043 [Capitella teleta]|uniref:Acetyl-coenzyme A synthetase n=1 Tax=Capitella teleta TaxID=283909 RepID=N1PBC6_CAPTE|nr:hypothetical protein CAPTEDRAFT_133043 [Capitella teleta]|eukprot:ELU18819.1 hypothetical protein CAPTEDRAFT_133043 [Capitella teleta]